MPELRRLPDSPAQGRHLTKPVYPEAACSDRPKATASGRCREVADEGKRLSVRRPVWNVDRALPAEELEQRLDIAAIGIHQAQPDLLVPGMARYIRVIGEKQDLAPIGRRMREPVAVSIGGQPLQIAAISAHPPDLHGAGAAGVEVNPLTVRRIIRAVIVPLAVRQPPLGSAFGRDRVDIESAVAFAAVGKLCPVRRPAVPVAWHVGRYLARLIIPVTKHVDAGLA
ncbi:hypothetical protein VF09_37305, partial [Nostoc linckia z9]